MFIGLLLRAMKSDVNLKRVAAFAKRVLQVLRIVYMYFFLGYTISFLVQDHFLIPVKKKVLLAL